ncbi:MAG: hypothetical protein ACRC20_10600 [Segniliparus sp.]|uniref:hypothetical protein n=1 Tax=Segniliparus sp. TaxID=2804064 RepID=UPI003F3D5AFF
MSIRAVFAAALAAAALPLAAPVAAHAESNDCVVLNNYYHNINDLLQQQNAVMETAHEAARNENYDEFYSLVQQVSHLLGATADQYRGAGSRVISPMYRQVLMQYAGTESELSGIYGMVASTRNQTEYQKNRGSELGNWLSDHSDDYDNITNAACSA